MKGGKCLSNKVVVVGMGYVGIPVAVEFAKNGFDVVGINRSRPKVDLINRGICPIKGDEPCLASLLRELVGKGKLRATQDFSVIKGAKAILVAVQTPFAKKAPNYSALESALESIGKHLQKDQLVVIESTIAPGTMDKIVKSILERKSGLKAGKDFMLGNCPERVMPGKLLYNIENLDRVVGGIDEKTRKAMIELYSAIVKGKLYPTDCLTAEVVKTAENAYRDVQIAFANELALICEKLGIDVYEVRDLVNKCPYRDVHIPGAGVGGHCLPKDSLLLNYGAEDFESKLMLLARKINDSMPYHVVDLVKKVLGNVKGKKIAVLGFAYLQDSDDTRNTPALPIVRELERLGANVVAHDPHVNSYENITLTNDLNGAFKDADCAVLVTAHKEYDEINLENMKKTMRNPCIVDGRNVFSRKEAEKLGFSFAGVGK
ncbi:MAG: nucleotide sugar dehydrogenase [Candidatus Methanofastidiosia archaeon]